MTLSPSFFLTEADTERLNIRGSRDPLGLVPLWGSFGRKVVGNLTTASSSVRGFTTLLLGFHFAERIAPSGTDRETVRLAVFLKFEQLAGYVRYLRNNDGAMRGITEIKRRIEEGGTSRIRIGAARDLQILSNQKTYGLWGLYTSPAVESGLVVRQDLVLNEAGRALMLKEYEPVFRKHGIPDGDAIASLLERERADVEANGRHARVFDALAKILSPAIGKAEREIYHATLIEGGTADRTRGWQPRFAQLVEKHLDSTEEFGSSSLDRIISQANRRADDQPLADHLQKIRHLEAVLVAMANLFGFLQDRDGAVLSDVCGQIATQWSKGLRHTKVDAIEGMKSEIAAVYEDRRSGDRFVSFAESIHTGDYDAAVRLVLEHNRFVMDARHKSQPWIIVNGKKLQVRYRDESQIQLLPPKELAIAWRNGFYLNPLKLVSDELRRSA